MITRKMDEIVGQRGTVEASRTNQRREMLFYKVPNADEALLITGGRAGKDGAPFKVVVRRGAVIIPPFRRAAFLSLAMQEAEISKVCYSAEGLELAVRAAVAFNVPTQETEIVKAGQLFITRQDKMVVHAKKIFAGHLHTVIGSMTIREIIQERQALEDKVLHASEPKMGKLGLIVNHFQIESIGPLNDQPETTEIVREAFQKAIAPPPDRGPDHSTQTQPGLAG